VSVVYNCCWFSPAQSFSGPSPADLLQLILSHSSPLNTHYGSQFSLVVFWQRIYYSLTVTSNRTLNLFFAPPNSFLAISSQSPSTAISKTRSNSLPSTLLYSSSQVKAKVTLRLMVSQSLTLGVESHLGLVTRYLLLLDTYGLVFCGAPSLTRGRVCHLYSAVSLESESLGTRDHILLSQI
jgi:hypothetical protein